MRKWSKAPRILSLLAVMIAAAVGFAPAAHAAEGDVMIGDSAYASVPEAVKAIVDKKEPQGSLIGYGSRRDAEGGCPALGIICIKQLKAW